MKLGVAVLLVATALIAPRSQAQVGVYGEATGAAFTNLKGTSWPIGVTTGVLVEGRSFAHHRIEFAGDVQGRFLNSADYNYNGVAVGARAYVPVSHGFRPYGEFAVGFARLKHTADSSSASTDAQIQINAGVAKKLSPRVDVVGEYSYSQFYSFGGEYNPKAISAGVVYYFASR